MALNKQTITIYTICWNEIFLLPHFFEHYKWANKIIVYDNGSDDGSQDFVKAQPKGELRFYDTKNKQNNDIMIDIKNNCWKGDTSDWVVVCDVDEFLMGHEKLRKYAGRVCVFECKMWEMVSKEVPSDFKSVTMKSYGPKRHFKSICFSPKIKEIKYTPGAHHSHPIPNNKIEDEDIVCYHYSCLSEDYLVKRWKRYATRIGKNDLIKRYTDNYLWEEGKIREEYRRRLCLAQPNS